MTSRTAVYGPVRTVVWEGRNREVPPYPDPINDWLDGLSQNDFDNDKQREGPKHHGPTWPNRRRKD